MFLVDYKKVNFPKELRSLSLLLTTYLSMNSLQNLIFLDSSSAAVRKINSCAEDNVGTSIWFALPFLLKFGGNVHVKNQFSVPFDMSLYVRK